MSLSVILRTRGQSVLDVFAEEFLFTFCRLTKGDDVNPLPGFCVNDGDGDAVNKPQRHKSRFILLETIIPHRYMWAPRRLVGHLRNPDRDPSDSASAFVRPT